MPKAFAFCKVCRRNHDQGRGHRYSTKHLQRLSAVLGKARQKMEEVLFFLNNPALLRQEDRLRNKFWCTLCELQIQEQDSLIACSNAIRHLASPVHEEKVKLFLSENGGKVDTKDMYIIKFEELLKWENASKALSVSSSSSGAGNRVGYPCLQGQITAKHSQKPLLAPGCMKMDMHVNIYLMIALVSARYIMNTFRRVQRRTSVSKAVS